MNRLERLLDLVHVLQTARAPVSLDALRELFPDYADGSPDATRRKFERDKAELAGIGLVLRFVSEEQAEHGGQDGYWLDADASYLVAKCEGAEGIEGEPMPKGYDAWEADKIAMLRAWIDAGALEE